MNIPEAARRLGCSTVTVRRRIKQGTLEGELQRGRRGAEYRVRLPSATGARADDATQAVIVLTTLLGQERAARDAAMADAAEHRERAAEWRTRAELLEAEVERLRAELERARRPWWRRWLGP